MKQLFLILLAAVNSVKSIPKEVITESTTLPPATTEVIPTYDYVVEIGFNLDEEKVPEYLVNIIYSKASENSITTDDIFTLYRLKTVDRITTLDYLDKLNISSEKVFSLDGFDKFLTELRVDFKEFYNKVIIEKLNITGNPLRDLLMTLNIDINMFSMGMAYGDPNPYTEFKKGNYTLETVTSALSKADRTLDDLFLACRDHFVPKALTFTPENITNILLRYDIDQNTALSLWKILGLTNEDVNAIPAFKTLLNELNRELNKVPCLGVLTAPNNITINRKVYETWSNDEDVVRPFAESISRKFILQILDTVDTEVENILVLNSLTLQPYENVLPSVEIGKTKGELKNCKFITLQNETVVIRDVSKTVNNGNHLQIPKENIINLIPGSPLICDNKLYGLAREIKEEDIILDGFSGVSRFILNGYLLTASIGIFMCIYFL